MREKKGTDAQQHGSAAQPTPHFRGGTIERFLIRPKNLFLQEDVIRMQVALVPAQRTDLVVTEQDMDSSACRQGLGFELAQQPEYLGDLCTTIKDVANDHKVAVSKGPVLLRVDDVVSLKQRDETMKVAVDIAHRGDAIRSGNI